MWRGILLGVLGAAFCLGQSKALTETKEKVAVLKARFQPAYEQTARERELHKQCATRCTDTIRQELSRFWPEKMAALNAIAEQIHAEVDRYISRTVSPSTVAKRWGKLRAELQEILGNATYWEAQPIAFDPAKTAGLLVVGYQLDKGGWHGPGATSFQLRAYRATDNRLVLSDSVGSDLDGFNVNFISALNPPSPTEGWFVVSGGLTGANGPNLRMRAFMLKEGKLRTMWMPADAWGDFKIRVTMNGFVVDGPYYRHNAQRHESYFVGPGAISMAGGSYPQHP